jgi:biotin-dependent carboxylase-like uncharacterized protein
MTDCSLLVLEPGLLTTIQDLGRPGLARFGVAPGGALDRAALVLGNRLVGNDPGDAALEMTLLGPRLRFTGPAVIAITGADLGARRGQESIPRWRPVAVQTGDELYFDNSAARDGGARAYLCIDGGIAVEPVLNSRSTDLVGGFGGLEGRALRAGDELPLQPRTDIGVLTRRLAMPIPSYSSAIEVRVVLGPQADRFTDEGVVAFLGNPYVVSAKADRMGVRLTGPVITHRHGADLVSEGIAHGAIQVPGDGQPIVLLAGRQTVGGYVKIATVIGADLDRLGQALPGTQVRFAAVDPPTARTATLAYLATLGEDAITTAPEVESDEGATGVGYRWDPAGVIQVIEALTAAGVTTFHLEVAAAGLKLDLHRNAEGRLTDEVGTKPAPAFDVVIAPLLGVFYRRSAPDAPPFVEAGDHVTTGQLLGVIEVMKTYHDVTAPHAGVLESFLIDDGQFVEYGQPIARLAPATEQSHDR